ncbi:polyhydroxyalkanoate granule-associated phasin [Noviherbaspirillum aerium]|uniref:polyhydroxyalkanoate granule-associated phasin n=1 Tax=Noviherbaspirillum aerium TaxID=2588497 RepID=UPI00124E2D8F|nr:polyhydroxyalkanoate granule-associated phasin [Noviherbaspirillum aerium]
MSVRRLHYPAANPLLVWSQVALKTGEMLFASAQVISHRTGRMAMAGPMPNARDRKEFTLMGQEKLEAAQESAAAMAMRLFAMQSRMGSAMLEQWAASAGLFWRLALNPAMAASLGGQAKSWQAVAAAPLAAWSRTFGSVAELAQHGLKPVHSRATANARRLAKVKLTPPR